MSVVTQQGIPAIITQGDVTSFIVSDPNYPQPDWSSTVKFKDAAGAVKSFTGVAYGSDHSFVLTNANTLTLVTGQNFVCVVFVDGSANRETSDWTLCTVLTDPTAASTPSYAQAQVTLLQTVMAQFNANGFKTVNFNGQSFTGESVVEYRAQLTYWQARVRFEQEQDKVNRGIKPIGNRIPLAFGPR